MSELNLGVAIVATRTASDGHGFAMHDPTIEGQLSTDGLWASGDEPGRLVVYRGCPDWAVSIAVELWRVVRSGEAVEGTHAFVSLPGRLGVTIAPLEVTS